MPHESAAEESFDSLYRSTRRALLLQTFALTGDLPVARARRARRLRRRLAALAHRSRALEDPMTWLRPRAWKHARGGTPSGPGAAPPRPRPSSGRCSTRWAGSRRAVGAPLVLVDLAGLDQERAAQRARPSPPGQAGRAPARASVAEQLEIPVGDVAAGWPAWTRCSTASRSRAPRCCAAPSARAAARSSSRAPWPRPW